MKKDENEGFIFWFNLRGAARRHDWKLLNEELQNNPNSKTPPHPFTLETMILAAECGQVGILRELLERGFEFADRKAAGALVRDLVVDFAPEALPAARYLLQGGWADPVPAIKALVEEGDVDLLKELTSGRPPLSPFALSSGFIYALKSGQPQVAELFAAAGANLYDAEVVKAAAAATPTMKTLHARLLDEDRKNYKDSYTAAGGKPKDLQHFRYVPPEFGLAPTSLMHLAARAGFFEHVAELAAVSTEKHFRAADILETDHYGVSLLDVMAARGEVKKLFDPRLWRHDPAEARDLYRAIKEKGLEDEAVDPAVFRSEVRRYNLRAQPDSSRFRLKPPGF